jgi:hypothetical protein
MLAPSWLKAGLTSAANKSIGSIYKKLNLAAFFPFRRIEYAKLQKRDMPRHTGCIKNMENTITNVKYAKFTMG